MQRSWRLVAWYTEVIATRISRRTSSDCLSPESSFSAARSIASTSVPPPASAPHGLAVDNVSTRKRAIPCARASLASARSRSSRSCSAARVRLTTSISEAAPATANGRRWRSMKRATRTRVCASWCASGRRASSAVRSARSAAAVTWRWAGSVAVARRTSASRSACTARGALTGAAPAVHTRCSNRPSWNTSVAVVSGCPASCSGAAKPGVSAWSGALAAPCSKAMPKSSRRGWPCASTSTFAGLMSRWISPRPWAYSTAAQTASTRRTRARASPAGSGVRTGR